MSSGTYYYFVKPVYNGSTTGPPSNEVSAAVGAVSSGVTIILRVGQPTMTVNGAVREIDPGKGTAPALASGRVFLPISSIVQAMGGHTTWNGAEKKVSVYLGTTTIDLWIGSSTARVNGVTKSLDAVPFISATGRTMLPLRFVAENLPIGSIWAVTVLLKNLFTIKLKVDWNYWGVG